MVVENIVLMVTPSAAYSLTARFRWRLPWPEIRLRLGFVLGKPKLYLAALAAGTAAAALGAVLSTWTKGFEGSTIAPFVAAQPSVAVLGAALSYAVLATGIPEEILFRGLIAGALFRRLPFWKANLIQALIFTMPHLLILLVAPSLWPLATLVPMAAGLVTGWLRFSSGSFLPGAIVHAASNLGGALAVMNWSAS
jgi:uncharacterized protein